MRIIEEDARSLDYSCYVAMLGGCQNYGPLLDPYYNTAPDI